MSLCIHLDKPAGHAYTNLDILSGHVSLDLTSDETISSIVVKLEGLVRTRLKEPKRNDEDRDSKRWETELHKVLYLTKTVFPADEVQKQTTSTAGFKLKKGEYKYPFQFRIPINNVCIPPTGILKTLSEFGQGFDAVKEAREQESHVRTTLPPSLSGIPNDMAWCRYFVKVTLNRPQFYRTNTRKLELFVLLPIEPPRPPSTSRETFVKREHTQNYQQGLPKKKRGLLGFRGKDGPPPPINQSRFYVEARLPSPPIITPNEPIPLRILFTKLVPFGPPIVLRSLQIRLQSTTQIRVHDIKHDFIGSGHAHSNMSLAIPVLHPHSPVGEELEADNTSWRHWTLPSSVQPSFVTCNIRRKYDLEIMVGISLGPQPQVELVNLLMPVEVFSGIRPPPELQLVNSGRKSSNLAPGSDMKKPPHPAPVTAASLAPTPAPPVTPTSASLPPAPSHAPPPPPSPSPSPSQSTKPPPLVTNIAAPAGPVVEYPFSPIQVADGTPPGTYAATSSPVSALGDLPPTYDEATALNIGPVSGPRREFQQEPDYFTRPPEMDIQMTGKS
ncbi:hypothetical protein DRE_05134 [Drechslerella stenobrocha 248]|uniref:Arrestin-like N-terminal domain-containing protein n=1 Tax=Drechslerella stenobrocha 248 TaxID=1043628 RepID=W7HZZ0_9PEZI|nr:hypothetical protein DRE_05134 [Drechslerella stenobrocha 248]